MKDLAQTLVATLLMYLNLAGKIVTAVAATVVLGSGILALSGPHGDGVFYTALMVWGGGAGTFFVTGLVLDLCWDIKRS